MKIPDGIPVSAARGAPQIMARPQPVYEPPYPIFPQRSAEQTGEWTENAGFGTERRTHRSLVNLCLSVLFLFALSRRLPFDEFQLSPAAVYLNQRINRFENVLQTMSGTPNSGAPLASGTNSNSFVRDASSVWLRQCETELSRLGSRRVRCVRAVGAPRKGGTEGGQVRSGGPPAV